MASSNKVVVLDYQDLAAFSQGNSGRALKKRLIDGIQEAYGPGKLGILTVKNVPGYLEKRMKLLKLAQRVATLPEEGRKALMDPNTNYLIGWSHGVEILQDGTPDTMKGSFYGNPVLNDPNQELRNRGQANLIDPKYDFYAKPNVWPKEIPELEGAFLGLGRLITEVGIKLGKACDEYVRTYDKNLEKKHYKPLAEMIEEGICHKGRLLHYFPSSKIKTTGNFDPEKWCGIHCDHSILTGLCCAIFLDENYNEVPNTDPDAGLYIVRPDGQKLKVSVPVDHIGFQLGHAAQVISNNFLRATPHLVRAPNVASATGNMKNISRNQFACFLQPFWGQKMYTRMKFHELVPGLSEKDFKSGMTFGDFSEKLVEHYHEKKEDTPAAKL